MDISRSSHASANQAGITSLKIVDDGVALRSATVLLRLVNFSSTLEHNRCGLVLVKLVFAIGTEQARIQ
jgi:hypothetical protein